MALPEFLVIGAQKSATTTLWRYLGQHPELFVARLKEPHFFCTPADGTPPRWGDRAHATLLPKLPTTAEAYQALFASAGGRRRGECSTMYLSDPAVPARVAAANPEVRIVAVLRDPVERAYSAWWMYRAKGDEPKSFAGALADEERRMARGWGLPMAYRTNSCYATHLARWRAVIDPAQMLILRYEDLVGDRQAALDRIFQHLGVSADFVVEAEVVENAARRPRGSARRRWWLAHLAPLRASAHRLLPGPVVDGLERRLRPPSTIPPMDPRDGDRLRASLLGEIERLEVDLGWDLTAWKSARR